MTPIDAERAFAADAKTIGQWTAFRKWSTDDAWMFVPKQVNAHEWLKDRKDPSNAIDWWPTTSWISCDRKIAVNTGGWKRPDGNVGYFTTIWKRQRDGAWKWILDHGDVLPVERPKPASVTPQRAKCNAPKSQGSSSPSLLTETSPDNSLFWSWSAFEDGSRQISVGIWDGKKFTGVVNDEVAAPPK